MRTRSSYYERKNICSFIAAEMDKEARHSERRVSYLQRDALKRKSHRRHSEQVHSARFLYR